jgi:hypothetical protein
VHTLAEVEILRDWGRETALRKKWMQMWERLGARILKFPKWLQVIILQDINVAIENRIATMEMICQAKKSRSKVTAQVRPKVEENRR